MQNGQSAWAEAGRWGQQGGATPETPDTVTPQMPLTNTKIRTVKPADKPQKLFHSGSLYLGVPVRGQVVAAEVPIRRQGEAAIPRRIPRGDPKGRPPTAGLDAERLPSQAGDPDIH